MRHWLWFVVAGAIVVASMVVAGLHAATEIAALEAGMKRVSVPGSVSIDLDKPGPYTLYVEKIGAEPRASGLSVRVVEESSGKPVALTQPKINSSYSIGQRAGVSFAAFNIEHAGAYRVTAARQGDAVDSGTMLAIEKGVGWEMGRVIFGAAAIGMVGFAIGGAVAAITIWQRSKSSQLKRPTTEA